MEEHEIAVVGAGPVGLTLALALARAGRRVVVLEKDASTGDQSRAPAIWAHSQEVFAGLGVIDRLRTAGMVLRRLEMWDADRDRRLLTLAVEELADETPYPQLLILPQAETERLLCEAVQAQPTAEVRFGAEVTGLDPEGNGLAVRCRTARGEERVRARFVAGCDGAGSFVRGAIGGSLEGITYATQAALADVRLEHDRDLRFPRLSSRDNLAVAIRIAPDLWRLILPFAAGDETPLARRVESAVRRLFASDGYETVWQSAFRLHRRVSTRWVAGRVVLAGDAAHLNSPAGGQGMNAGIADAAALATALGEALDGDDPAPLAAYAEARQRAVGGVNRYTDRLTRLLIARRGRLVRPALRLVDLVARVPPLRRRLLRRVAMTDP